MLTSKSSTGHAWRFFRAGGFDQVRLDAGTDLLNLDQLDQKLWVALACPTSGLEFDAKTLALIDTDQDGRIRAPELIAAVQWAGRLLKNAADLLNGASALPLSAINDATPEGKQLLASARHILANLGRADAPAITLEDTADTAKIFAATHFNGDGIVPADAADDPALKAVMDDILACFGTEIDRSGKPGLSQAKADQFFAEAAAHSDWWKQAEGDATILPLGAATAAAAAAVETVRAKVDDYFTRCRLAAFDARAVPALNREEKEYLAFAAKDLTLTTAEIAGLPLARVEANRPLPLGAEVNPAWADAVTRLRVEALEPLLGPRPALSEADWHTLLARLEPYKTWLAGKAGGTVEKLGLTRVREILGGPTREQLAVLIAKDKAEEANANAIVAVDRLVRYYRDLYLLCVNFVNFKDLYDGEKPAIFQAGTLYLDQRSCNLCLPVNDAAKHAAMAGLAGTYLAYCECVRKGTGEKMQIVAAFTDGDSDNLMVGRNGLFYDRKGRDWDATITKIIDNPISIRQAFWSPYKKLVRMIEEQIAKRAAAAETESTTRLESVASAVATADKAKPAAGPKRIDVGTVAALGVAVGSLGTAFGYFLNTIAGIEPWQFPLLLAAIVLIISGPSMLIAFLKLRKRNLGPILDANGWAVNAKARINVPFGTSLTAVAKLPAGAHIETIDPFAERKSKWPKVLVALFFLWWVYVFLNDHGFIYRWTEGDYGKPPKVARPKKDAPAATPVAATNAPVAPH